jgi:hypothetical protein
LAQQKGIPVGGQPSWKTISKVLHKFAHLETIPAHQLVDGRTIAHQPSRTDPRVKELALQSIEIDFATRTFESVSGALERANDKINAYDTLHPSEGKLPGIGRTAIDNLISDLPGMDLCEAKFGRKAARESYDIVGKLPKPAEPMTIVEFDWHKIDLKTKYPAQARYLSQLAGIPIDRLWLIAGVDAATGWCAGFTWSVGDPDTAANMRAFAHICRYKPSYSHLGVQGNWLPHGIPKLVKLDHGKANLAHDVIRAGGTLGIEFDIDESHNPKKRPNVERFFGTVKTDFISKLDGAIGHNVLVRPERSALPAELLATDELDRRFIRWVCDRHANNTARTRTHSPRTAYLNYEKANPGWSPDTARSEEELDRELRVSITSTASNEGVVWLNVWYNGLGIQKIRSDCHAHRCGNPDVEWRIHPDDINDVIVLDPHPETGGWKKYPHIECLYRAYAPGKSMVVHKIIHNAVRAGKKERQKITEPLLEETYVQVTRRAVEKVMKRRPTARTVGQAAQLGQLMTPGAGATPFPERVGPELSPQEIRQSLRAANQPVGPELKLPDEATQADPAAARARLMSGRPNIAAAVPLNASSDSNSTNHSAVSDDEY